MQQARTMGVDGPRTAAVVLMYHALRKDTDVPQGQDPHYTLPTDVFARQMQAVRAAGGGGSVRDWVAGASTSPILLTFDDGHVSNAELALDLLASHGARADFFVNPANVGKPGFASWQQLRALAEHGMSIQSHGNDHTYLTALPPSDLRQQLRRARQSIEDAIGSPVSLLAPPGGRMPPNLPEIAVECGYRHVVSSRPGIARGVAKDIPRMSVTAATQEGLFARWLAQDARSIRRDRLRYTVLGSAKRLLGDAAYERLRARALGTSHHGGDA